MIFMDLKVRYRSIYYTFVETCNIYGSIMLCIMYKDRTIRIVNGMDPAALFSNGKPV